MRKEEKTGLEKVERREDRVRKGGKMRRQG